MPQVVDSFHELPVAIVKVALVEVPEPNTACAVHVHLHEPRRDVLAVLLQRPRREARADDLGHARDVGEGDRVAAGGHLLSSLTEQTQSVVPVRVVLLYVLHHQLDARPRQLGDVEPVHVGGRVRVQDGRSVLYPKIEVGVVPEFLVGRVHSPHHLRVDQVLEGGRDEGDLEKCKTVAPSSLLEELTHLPRQARAHAQPRRRRRRPRLARGRQALDLPAVVLEE
mmetsp:Transcript_67310/g.174397  ORF Transcript_67310/g.174397 Transcript_67310/m.174397 type:complete len:224 (-) Transcript_67310:14-685(-)